MLPKSVELPINLSGLESETVPKLSALNLFFRSQNELSSDSLKEVWKKRGNEKTGFLLFIIL